MDTKRNSRNSQITISTIKLMLESLPLHMQLVHTTRNAIGTCKLSKTSMPSRLYTSTRKMRRASNYLGVMKVTQIISSMELLGLRVIKNWKVKKEVL